MTDYGIGVRKLIDAVAVAFAARDADEAVLALKAVARDVRFKEMVPIERREEAEALFAALRARTLSRFEDWMERYEAPAPEIKRALALFEETSARGLPEAAAVMEPKADGPETALAAYLQIAKANPVFEEDIVARDIGWAMARYAFEAGRDYAPMLAGVDLMFSRA